MVVIGVLKESHPSEKRVALIPANVEVLCKGGNTVLVQKGAGEASGFTDESYSNVGAELVDDRAAIFERANIVVQVQAYGCNDTSANDDLSQFKAGQTVVGMMDPLGSPKKIIDLAEAGVTAVALELVPRISRAQSMDVLTSMATIAGYKSVLIGASTLGSLMPLMMTAAGTLKPARVFIMGAGVAGLQAAAMAKRLGAVVEAYDVRPAAQEQILSVGAKPIQLELPEDEAEGKGGYAKAQGEDFLANQRRQMAGVLAQQDLVITTAAIPGSKSPILVTAEMVTQMKPGAVIVDLAAERGGNCELTQLDQIVVENGVTILGPSNIPSTVPHHASQMYGKNVENLLMHILDENGEATLDFEDEIIAETVVAHQSEIIHSRMRSLLELDKKETTEVTA